MLPYTIQPSLEEARSTAEQRGLRERVVCYVTRDRRDVLVFEHDARYPDAGVQVPAGGIDPGETLEQAAAREAWEETGLEALSAPVYLGSALHDSWQPPQLQHYFWLEAADDAPNAWDHFAEGQYTFHHRFEAIPDTVIHWGLDAFIPQLARRLNLEVTQTRNNTVPVAVCYITRVQDSVAELLILRGHPDGGVQVVAGGIDNGETPEQAAIREAWEEAGLRLQNPVFLGRAEYHFKGVHPDTHDPLELHEDRYFYHFTTNEPRERWDHMVSAGEDDGGKVFRHGFVRLEDARLDWDLGWFLKKASEHV
jgi:8-oxo-dGTP pyrophosphatase MutT (NUDIX family)